MKIATIATLGTVLLLSSGCVTKQTHEAVLQELDTTRQSLASAQNIISDQHLQIKQNEAEIARSRQELADLDLKKGTLQRQLNDSQRLLNETEARLRDSRSQIETLRQIEEETKKRNEIYTRFIDKLQKMIDGGQLTVTIDKGRLVINLPENVLFASGQALLNPQGEETLVQVAALLKEFPDRRFQIEGHTDNVPIHNARFASNWELSSGRALSVVHLMLNHGVASENLSAAGFGEFHPRADNESVEGRALNRRIEIVMQPNLEILSSELPNIPR
ncbi:MAG: OmpA family protein [Campylobacterales bacterium]|nr:OmpA family protein [Campylobacterales bacterium]